MNGECCKVETTRNYLFILSEEEDFRVRFVDSNHTVVVSDGIYKQHTHIMYEIILVELQQTNLFRRRSFLRTQVHAIRKFIYLMFLFSFI